MKALDFATVLCIPQVPISGGGMTSGIALAAKNLAPNCRYDALTNKNRMIMLRKKKIQTAFLQTFEQGRSSGASRKGAVALFAEQRKAVSGSDFSFFEY